MSNTIRQKILRYIPESTEQERVVFFDRAQVITRARAFGFIDHETHLAQLAELSKTVASDARIQEHIVALLAAQPLEV